MKKLDNHCAVCPSATAASMLRLSVYTRVPGALSLSNGTSLYFDNLFNALKPHNDAEIGRCTRKSPRAILSNSSGKPMWTH